MHKLALKIALLFAAVSTSVFLRAEEITIVGTGSGVEVLAALGQVFTQAHPDVTVTLPDSIGSGGAIKAVGTDKAVIGRVARGIKDSEKPFGLSYLPVAKLPIVFMVNKSVEGVKNLTAAQLCDIYSGKIVNWKEVGGADGAIRVVRREDGDSSLDVLLKSLPGFKQIVITPKSKTTLSDPATIELVEKTPGTIAFGTYPNAKVSNVDVLTIDGLQPTQPDYPHCGTLALIFKPASRAGSIALWLDFVSSPGAQVTIKSAGGL